MADGEARAFGNSDPARVQPRSVAAILEAALKAQPNKAFATCVRLPYGQVAWDKNKHQMTWRGNPQLKAFADSRVPVVAVVTEGAMEIYETETVHVGTDKGEVKRERRKTTQVLEPGKWFGLFEAYAAWAGDWTITSGVVSFMVCNPIGNEALWKGTGLPIQAQHMKIQRASNLMFDQLVTEAARKEWFSESVWLRPGLIQNTQLRAALENELMQITIGQLMSVLKQSPTWGQIGQRHTPTSESLCWQYLDSVIEGDTPIFQLADHEDATYFPVRGVLDSLAKYDKNGKWNILVPITLRDGGRGIHPVQYVSRFPDDAEQCILGMALTSLHTQADHLPPLALSRGFAKVRYKNASVSVRTSVAGQGQRAPEQGGSATRGTGGSRDAGGKPPHPISLLADCTPNYQWPHHFNTVLVVEKDKALRRAK
jgi:hypothetical protein